MLKAEEGAGEDKAPGQSRGHGQDQELGGKEAWEDFLQVFPTNFKKKTMEIINLRRIC